MPIGFESCAPRTGAPLVPLMISPLATLSWMRGSGRSSGYQKVRPVTPGLLRGLLGAPFGDLGVMSANQDVRHFPAAIFGGARVLRGVQKQSSLARMEIIGHRNGLFDSELAEGFVFSGRFVP